MFRLGFFLDILLSVGKTLDFTSYFQHFECVNNSSMIVVMGFLDTLNTHAWKPQLGPTWILVGRYFFGQVQSIDAL